MIFQAPTTQPTSAQIFSDLYVANTAFVAVACLLVVWLSWQCYRQHRAPFLLLWMGSWSSYLVGRLLTLVQAGQVGPAISDPTLTTLLSAVSQTGYYLHVVLVLLGVLCVVDGDRWRPRLRTVGWVAGGLFAFTLVVAVGTLGTTVTTRMLLRVGLRCLITAGVCAVAGWKLYRHGQRDRRLGARFTAVALLGASVMFGMHAYAFSVGRWTEIAFLGSFEIVVICAMGLGLVLWMKEGLHADAERVSKQIVERTQVLLQSQRLESMGQLAGGVAHDFNNVLTVVLANTDGLLRTPGLSEAVRSNLEETRSAAVHAARMTSQLLTLARDPGSQRRVFDLNSEVRDLMPLLRNLAGVRVELRLDLHREPLRVLLMRGHLEQVLINLVVNARDAIQEAGVVTIETGLEPLGARRGVVLVVRDTGAGMTPEVQARIGELFFTTKGGRGTGMGMAAVRSILQDTGGVLGIDSTLGQGAALRILWPEAELVAGQPITPPDYVVPRPQPAKILLAEDDVMVRKVTRRTLEAAGHEVLAPETSVEAADLLRDHPGPIALLLTDVVMPQISGPELAALSQSLRKETKIRFVSGYIDDNHQAQLPAGIPVLSKPFTRQELLAFVATALEQPAMVAGATQGQPS